MLGYLPPDDTVRIPERHLGLLTTRENSLDSTFIRRITGLVERHIDLDLLVKMASPVSSTSFPNRHTQAVLPANQLLSGLLLPMIRPFAFTIRTIWTFSGTGGQTLPALAP